MPKRILDVGTGCGGFVHYAREAGLDCIGVDFSRYAISHPFKSAKGHIYLADARKLPYPDNSFYLVTYMDIMEHIYEEDLPKVISEAQRVSSRWIFYNISVAEDNEPEIKIKKGQLPQKEFIASTVPGHVNIRHRDHWRKILTNDKWRLRDDLVKKFREAVDSVDPRILANWRCIIITERVRF